MCSLEGSRQFLQVKVKLDETAVQGEVVDPDSLGTLHLLDKLPKDCFQLVQAGQGDLPDLQQPVLLVADLADLVGEVVQSSMHKPAHQRTEDAAEDGGGDKDGRVARDL